MGAPHQFDGVKTLSPRAPSRSRRKSTLDGSVVERHFLFWLAVLVLVVLALWLLSEILLPFVAGLAIAYLLTPLTDRLERFGINRPAPFRLRPQSACSLALRYATICKVHFIPGKRRIDGDGQFGCPAPAFVGA